ncbi:MAG: DNA-processing protein DprA [Actinomycetota bacterium]|nr:DNA-processing protein DprA [Actinomycetota bacterium]
MRAVEACDACLRRAWLVGSLSARIERAISGVPGRRSRELLALGDARLAAAVAGSRDELYLERSRARDPRRLRAAVVKAGAWACCRHDDAYPPALRELADAPRLLFGRGDPTLLGSLEGAGSVTVVGARHASAYGRQMATGLGLELAASGLAVVSGMALGIDSCAHEGALREGGLTVAVLGSGPDVPSPAGRRALYERIRARGLILSELPPGTEPRRWTFPARNRIMAALGTMTVVVEARARSGSLITSELAEQLGREVGAVPGRVGSPVAEGANALLRDGAQVIRSGQDVLDSVLGPGAAAEREAQVAAALDRELVEVLDAIDGGAATQDAVAQAAGLDAGVALTSLARLELLGVVNCDSAGRYARTPLSSG